MESDLKPPCPRKNFAQHKPKPFYVLTTTNAASKSTLVQFSSARNETRKHLGIDYD
jgi:hypothetical protein